MKNSHRFITIFIILLCFVLSGCSTATHTASNEASEGNLDLCQWDFDHDGITLLDGEWQFYWNKLLTYEDIDNNAPDLIADVPNTWDNYTINGAALPAFGYATYRLHVKTSLPDEAQMGLWINNFSSAYNLYINDELVSSNGRVAKSANEEIGKYSSRAVYFKIPESEFDILIQASNFHYARGGFWYNLVFGNSESIRLYDINKSFVAAALFGILVIIFLYCIAVYLMLREIRMNLIFGLLCLFLCLYLDALNMTYLWKLLPTLSIGGYVFIWYSSGIWAMFLLVAYFSEIFKSRFSTIVTKVFFLSYRWVSVGAYSDPRFGLYSQRRAT